ncbi:MAG: beta-propeller domain-containing protein, partial [Firmicutes bacterium]|nr:beta-propeller domain-containing protein [Bacillota bacterium]
MNKEDLKRSFDQIDTEKQLDLSFNKAQKAQRNRLIGIIAASCAFMLIATFVITGLLVNYPVGEEDSVMRGVSSREEIIRVIEDYNEQLKAAQNAKYGGLGMVPPTFDNTVDVEEDEAQNNNYTKTNTQVEGVDEGDIVKVDENSIYKLSQNGFLIVNAQNGEICEPICRIEKGNYVPLELYIKGDKLIMIGGIYEQFYYGGQQEIMPAIDCMAYLYYSKTEIEVYNIANKESPKLERSITIDGNYLTSRMIGNKVYYMVNYGFYYGYQDTYIPKIKDSKIGEAEKEIKISDIYYFKDVPLYNYTILGYINLSDTNDLNQKAYLGVGGEIYVNAENIYSAAWDYSQCLTRNIFGKYSYDNTK